MPEQHPTEERLNSEKTIPVILCGGEGTRLASHSEETIKPLVKLAGEPLIAHSINAVRQASLGELVLAAAYNHSQLLENKDLRFYLRGLTPHWSIEESPNGIISAIQKAIETINNSVNLVILNGDEIRYGLDLSAFIAEARGFLGNLTLAVSPHPNPEKHYRVILDGNQISDFCPRGKSGAQDTDLVIIGVAFVPYSAVGELKKLDGGWDELLYHFLERKRLSAIVTACDFFNINRPDDFREAEDFLGSLMGLPA